MQPRDHEPPQEFLRRDGVRLVALKQGDRGMDSHGHQVEYDEGNGFQHLDGSVQHDDGTSVTDGPVRDEKNTEEIWRPHTAARVYGPFYHAGNDPHERTDNDYIHIGTEKAAGQRHGGDRTLHQVWVHAAHPMNAPEDPLDDYTANRIGMYDAHRNWLGRDPKPEDFDPDFEEAPEVARGSGWRPEHDAVFYQNDAEDPGSLSAMVRPSAIRRPHTAAIEHDVYEPKEPGATHRHWFENYDSDSNSRGFADVHEFPDHAELDLIKTHPGDRGHGHGSELLDHVTNHFKGLGKPVHLNPMPADYHHPGPDEDVLRDWYGHHGFEDDPHSEWMIHEGAYAQIPEPIDDEGRRPYIDHPGVETREQLIEHMAQEHFPGYRRDLERRKDQTLRELHQFNHRLNMDRPHEDPAQWTSEDFLVHRMKHHPEDPDMSPEDHATAHALGFGHTAATFSALPYMPEPEDLGEHLRLRHGMDPEVQLHGDAAHWKRWHDSEHANSTNQTHQHIKHHGIPLEDAYPDAHEIPEDASDVMGISGGTSTRPWQDVRKTGPVMLPDPNAHLSKRAAFWHHGLQNPHTRGEEWFHGTMARPHELSQHGFGHAEVNFQQFDEDGENILSPHWNAMLGPHFAADHHVADTFGRGENPSTGSYGMDEDEGHPSVTHVKLHIANPKHYRSEHDMDHEVYEHEHARGNHIDNYLSPEQDGYYEDEYEQPLAHKFRGDSTEPPISASETAGREAHPMRGEWLKAHPDKEGIAARFKARVQAEGYDGITYGNEWEKSKHGGAANTCAIAFHPHQVEVTQHHGVHEPCLSREEGELHQRRLPGPHDQELPFHEGAWHPDSGIFSPTTGLDQALFDEAGHVRPEVRREIIERAYQALSMEPGLHGRLGLDPAKVVRIYLAGGAVSEWAGHRPNEVARDLDVLIGFDHHGIHAATGGRHGSDDELDGAANQVLRAHFNDETWRPSFGGVWSLTGYVNPHAWDISNLRPYAAYDLTNDRWAVKPPHSPEHPVELGYDPGPQARAIASEIRAVLRLPEPFRTQEARNIWDRIHADRSLAFSPEGGGFTAPGNTVEKWLAYHPHKPLDKLRSVVFAERHATQQEHAPDGRAPALDPLIAAFAAA